jgi:hypothetical protein
MCYANPLHIGCRCHRRDLWCFFGTNFRPAATHLFHPTALAVHCLAASTLLMTHHYVRYTCHHGRGCGEQEEDCDETGKTAHRNL